MLHDHDEKPPAPDAPPAFDFNKLPRWRSRLFRVRYAVARRIHTDEAVNPEASSASGRSTQVLEGIDHIAK